MGQSWRASDFCRSFLLTNPGLVLPSPMPGTSIRPTAPGGYYPALDGLRAVAVSVVLAGHLRPSWEVNPAEGVYIFFVLSGFLITGILMQEQRARGEVSFANFYARRALRLLPALIVCLMVSSILVVTLHPEHLHATKIGVPASLFYYSNWVRAFSSDVQILGPFGHTWSLSVEEQFYLLWPIPLIWAYRRSARLALALALGLALGSLVCRTLMYDLHAADTHIYNGLETNIEFLRAGCAVAILQPRAPEKTTGYIILGLVAAFALAAQIHPLTRGWLNAVVIPELRLTVTTLGAAMLIYVLAAGVRIPILSPILEFGPVRWIGRISYGIYLYHVLVFFLLPPLPEAVQRVLAVVHARNLSRIGTVLAVAALSYYAIERPFLRMKSRFRKGSRSRQRPAGVAAAATDGAP
jgi:peptidoglycan/LPS O-acetylase OafA/YrhL